MLFTTDGERLLYELALKRKEGKNPLVEYDKEDVWGDIGDIDAAKEGYLFGGTFGTGNALVKSVRADVKNAPDADRKRIKADFGEPEKNAESGSQIKKSLTDENADSIIGEKNKRNITIITDKTVEKVPRITVPEFAEEQNDFIQNQHKDLLKYARDNNDNKEIAFVFRKDLTDKTVFVGSDDVIDFGNRLLGKGDGLFVMHNHPRNSSFSDMDISLFISNDNIKGFSIVKNNGCVEIITKTERYSIEKMKIIYGRAYKKFVVNGTKEEIDKAIEYILRKNGGIVEWKK